MIEEIKDRWMDLREAVSRLSLGDFVFIAVACVAGFLLLWALIVDARPQKLFSLYGLTFATCSAACAAVYRYDPKSWAIRWLVLGMIFGFAGGVWFE